MEDQTYLEVPIDCCCPISLEPMVDPVILVETGQTYERACIERWLMQAGQNKTDPVTGAALTRPRVRLVPNHAVRKLVQSITDSSERWARQAADLKSKSAEVGWRSRELDMHQSKLELRRQALESQRAELRALMKELAPRQSLIKQLEAELNLKRSQLKAREKTLRSREVELVHLADAVAEQEAELAQRTAALEQQKQKMKQRYLTLGWKKCQQALGVSQQSWMGSVVNKSKVIEKRRRAATAASAAGAVRARGSASKKARVA